MSKRFAIAKFFKRCFQTDFSLLLLSFLLVDLKKFSKRTQVTYLILYNSE